MVQYKDVPDYYFKKALALEKLGKYEEAIECYDKILGIDPHALNAYHSKGVALEKLGKHEEAAKCFDKEKQKKKISAEKVPRSELLIERVWSRIIKNEEKLFKTKTGVVFSYRITNNGKSIMPQYRLQNSGPEFPVYSEGRYITNTLVERALDIVPVVGPTELKILLEMQSLDTSHRHLWGILNDERTSNGDW